MNQLRTLALGKGSFMNSDFELKSELWCVGVTARHVGT